MARLCHGEIKNKKPIRPKPGSRIVGLGSDCVFLFFLIAWPWPASPRPGKPRTGKGKLRAAWPWINFPIFPVPARGFSSWPSVSRSELVSEIKSLPSQPLRRNVIRRLFHLSDVNVPRLKAASEGLGRIWFHKFASSRRFTRPRRWPEAAEDELRWTIKKQDSEIPCFYYLNSSSTQRLAVSEQIFIMKI